MIKTVNYKGRVYHVEILWTGSSYCVQCIETRGFASIPMDALSDIEKIKPFIIEAIENNHELKAIELWDGKL